jgi:hypothetical protein
MSEDTYRFPAESPCPAVRPLSGKLLGELARPVAGGEDELIRNRFLCRGGTVLLIAGTGLGKSVLVLMWAIVWAVGKGFAGLVPTKPLRIWLIQGENSEGDIAEQRDGILWGLAQTRVLSEAECEAARSRVRIVTEMQRTGHDFGEWLTGELHNAQESGQLPDIIIIDPAYTYLGADASSQADVSTFLRNIVGPILAEFGIGLVLVHHANKPALASQRKERTAADFVYAGAGSAEWCNFARGTLVLEQTEARGMFILHAGKNGHKLGWRDPVTDEPVYQRHIAHATDGKIYWREPGIDETAAAQACQRSEGPSAKRQAIVDDVVPLGDVPRTKADFLEHVKTTLKVTRDPARHLIKVCVDRGLLEEAVVNVYPRYVLIGPPGVTAAEAGRRAGEKDAVKAAPAACSGLTANAMLPERPKGVTI